MAAVGPNLDQFEAYFRKADLDGDGRISGAEAVAFFQGSNLPKQVLAQVWRHADQSKTGFLGRAEFYNALRLVTVAQSKRDLTPDIVKAALYGPAAAKIPAPQINIPATSAPQPNSMAAAPVSQLGSVAPSSQSFGFRGPTVANANINQRYFPPQQSQSVRPPQAMPTANLVAPNVQNPSMSNEWVVGKTGVPPNGPGGINPIPSSAPRPQVPGSTPLQPTVNDSNALVSGNGVPSTSSFGGDVFSATPSLPKQEPSRSMYPASSASSTSAAVPVSSGPQSSGKNTSINSLQDAFSIQPKVSQFQQPQSPLNPGQQASLPGSSTFTSSGISVGMATSTPGNSQLPWPKMKPSDVQKYMKVFMEVDTDRDGRITGEQARNLFLSWRLPREVLKQVWDLSDQDKDSMLSLREFCFALYLMERSREGRPLPAALPNSVMLDETLMSMTGQPGVPYGNAAWSPSPGIGFGQQQRMPGAQPLGSALNSRPQMQTSSPKPDGVQSNQQSSRAPVLEDSFLDQHENGHHSKPQEPAPGGKKTEEVKNAILDSKEKIEYYRTKMQELVLYKSRCDNKLNEITERASADKREAELLAKKYEEKYKQVAEIASKLTIEEATFRDIQERKMELNQAIAKMEQGGSADGILQVRADRIQYDLEELIKALTERCKKHGLHIKSNAIIELPNGWAPGIQEGATVWDEEWDKFEDEGFVSDLTVDVKSVSIHPTSQSNSVHREIPSPDGVFDTESVFNHNEDEHARSPRDSPAGRTAAGSPSQEFSDGHYGKGSETDAETRRSFDESNWGDFGNNDDVDSVWGFNVQKTNNTHLEKNRDLFGSDSFSVNPVRTGSPQAESAFHRKSPFTFDDSVPGTPLSRFGNSPRYSESRFGNSPRYSESRFGNSPRYSESRFGNSPRYSEAGDHYFDNFTRFDSFSTHEGGFSSQPERLTRFDSINSSKDFAQSSLTDFGHSSFTRFDSISSSRDFGHNPERLARFDSINSSQDLGHSGALSFDDTDPFGSSGPFKVSSESQIPKKGSDNWSAF